MPPPLLHCTYHTIFGGFYIDNHNILWYINFVIDCLCAPRETRGQIFDLVAAESCIAYVVWFVRGVRTALSLIGISLS